MSSSDDSVVAIRIFYMPEENSGYNEGSPYSYRINDEALCSAHSLQYAGTQDDPDSTPPPRPMLESAQDASHLQSNSASTSHLPPGPVGRIVSRQAFISKPNANSEPLDQASKSSSRASSHSSMSYDGDLTLDDKIEQEHIRFTTPTSIIFTSEELRELGISGYYQQGSFVEAPRPRYPRSPFPSFVNDQSGSEEVQRNPEDIPLPASLDENDKESYTKLSDCSPNDPQIAEHSKHSLLNCQHGSKQTQAGMSSSITTNNDSKRAHGVTRSLGNSPRSPCSSLLDLYLEPSHQSPLASTNGASTGETMRDCSSSWRRIQSSSQSKDHSLNSPAQKIRSWISDKMLRVSANGQRPTSDSFYHQPLQPIDQKFNARTNYLKVETDGYTSRTTSDIGLRDRAYETPLEDASLESTTKDPKVSQESFSAVPQRSTITSNDFPSDNSKSLRIKTATEKSRHAYEPLRANSPYIGYSNGSRSSRKAGSHELNGQTKLQPTKSNRTERSPIFSNIVQGYSRTPKVALNRDALHSPSHTRVNASETIEPLICESPDDIEMDNFIGCDNSVHITAYQAESDLSDARKPLHKNSSKIENSHEQNDAKTTQTEPSMPGTYPIYGHRDRNRTDAPKPAVKPRATPEASSRLTNPSLPASRLRPTQAVITEHKPAHERVRYPEPFFVPVPTTGTSQFDSGSEHIRHSQDVTAFADPYEPKIMRENVRKNVQPDIQPRISSSISHSRSKAKMHRLETQKLRHIDSPRGSWETDGGAYVTEFPRSHDTGIELHSFDGEALWSETHDVADGYDGPNEPWVTADAIVEHEDGLNRQGTTVKRPKHGSALRSDAAEKLELREFQKGHRRHHSFRGRIQASLHRAQRKGVLARDWESAEKRFTAIVACASTALIGIIVGIYAGQVPAIQYAIVDEHSHHAVLGNVFFYIGLAVTTILAWPVPLLYGRKRLILSGLAILLVLQFPQALVVSQQRNPLVSTYRVGLLLPRFLSGFVAGLANVNFWPTLLDVYGSSLQSQNPHQELINENDPRRHGGGMGIWLGIWTWCHIGSIGVGFVIGAVIIGYLNVAWGFWVVIFATLAIILMNVIAPETRPSVYRKSLAEVRKGADVSRRVGRGEVMMHLYSTGPLHWWEEVGAGIVLNFRMIKQSGFTIMAFYQGWIYGQVVMIMILLGALASRYYYLRPQYVASCVAAFPIGALIAVPFQKASVFSRSRHRAQRTDSMTFEKRVTWSSHLVRRTVFMAALPLVAVAYTLTSTGPPLTIGLPCLFAAFIGFLTNLALSECYGLIMETFDTSDLQPGMTGRLRKELSEDVVRQRTNFSCYPRVTAGFSIVQTISFIIAAIATAVGGNVERARGVQMATVFVAAVLIGLTIMLIGALTRFRTVQIVPTNRVDSAELSGPGDDLPVIIGHPSGTTRRISLLELGSMTRWTEIRRRNKLLGSGRHGKYT